MRVKLRKAFDDVCRTKDNAELGLICTSISFSVLMWGGESLYLFRYDDVMVVGAEEEDHDCTLTLLFHSSQSLFSRIDFFLI